MRDDAEFSAPISREIWDLKYRLKDADGAQVDSSLDDTFWRVARAAAAAEKGGKKAREQWAKRFHDAMCRFRLPAGRPHPRRRRHGPLRHALQLLRARARSRTTSAPSSTNVKEAALTMQQGGGIGHDFSTLRPKGAPRRHHRRRRLGPGQLHGRVGRDVPHHHVGRQPPRRHDGHAALRPSRHRGLHRRQVGPGAAAQFQSVGARHRRLPRRRARRRALGSEVRRQGLPHAAGARAVGAHHARDLRLSPSPASSSSTASTPATTSPTARRSTPPILAASSRCRRTAPACWARSIWRGSSSSRSPPAPLSTAPSSKSG